MKNLNLLALENFADALKIIFSDEFCEEIECDECPFYKKVKGHVENEDCLYLCDFLFQVKERL